MAGIGTGLAALNLAARFPRVASVFAAIPKPVWEAIAVVGYVLALFALHQHYADAAIARHVQAAIAQRDQQWEKRFADEHAAALRWKAKADAQAATISTQQRNLNDETQKRLAADAAAVRLRGPGKAAAPAGCRPGSPARISAATSGHVEATGAGSNAASEVPAGDGSDQWAVVPWGWVVDVVQERDSYAAELTTWHRWYDDEAAAWLKADPQAQPAQAPATGQTPAPPPPPASAAPGKVTR